VNAPDFTELSDIEEKLLAARRDAVRRSIAHAGEKGRSLEHVVMTWLRDFLPAEYGLSTGFVVWISPEGPKLSPQLNIIIYDAIHSGPIVRLQTCDVFPLEAVYGYVEVKAALRSRSDEAKEFADDSIEACVQRNATVRAMGTRHFVGPAGGSPSYLTTHEMHWLSVRSFIIAFEAVGTVAGDLAALGKRLATVLKIAGPPAHVHGVFIPQHGLLSARPVNAMEAEEADYFHVRHTSDHPLLALKGLLLESLATFPRPYPGWSASFRKYFNHEHQWSEEVPDI
jgi:uncharacterized protein DUF6602